MRRLIVGLGAAVVAGTLFFGLASGVAFADHGGGTEWTCDDAGGAAEGAFCEPDDWNPIGPAADQLQPVGLHINDNGLQNGFLAHTEFGAFANIVRNPLCPFHGVETTP